MKPDAPLPNEHPAAWAFRQKVGDGYAKAVLMALAERVEFRNKNGKINGVWTCFPSHPMIATDVEFSIPTVKRALHYLRDHGFISWVPNNATLSNLYTLRPSAAASGAPTPQPRSNRPSSNRPGSDRPRSIRAVTQVQQTPDPAPIDPSPRSIGPTEFRMNLEGTQNELRSGGIRDTSNTGQAVAVLNRPAVSPPVVQVHETGTNSPVYPAWYFKERLLPLSKGQACRWVSEINMGYLPEPPPRSWAWRELKSWRGRLS